MRIKFRGEGVGKWGVGGRADRSNDDDKLIALGSFDWKYRPMQKTFEGRNSTFLFWKETENSCLAGRLLDLEE